MIGTIGSIFMYSVCTITEHILNESGNKYVEDGSAPLPRYFKGFSNYGYIIPGVLERVEQSNTL